MKQVERKCHALYICLSLYICLADPNTPFDFIAPLTSSPLIIPPPQEQPHCSLPLRQTNCFLGRRNLRETSSPQPFERQGPGRRQEERERQGSPQAGRAGSVRFGNPEAACRQRTGARPRTLTWASVMAAGPLPPSPGHQGGPSGCCKTRSGPGRGRAGLVQGRRVPGPSAPLAC